MYKNSHIILSIKALRQCVKSYGSFKGLPQPEWPKAREVAYPVTKKPSQIRTIQNAFDHIKSGDNIFVHGIAATPTYLLNGLVEHVKANNLTNIKLHHLHLEGEASWLASDVKGTADFNSIFLQDTAKFFRQGVIKLNVALVNVSAPDSKGFCSLGTSVDAARAAVTTADYIIGLSNKKMPRTFGDSVIHSSHIDVLVEGDFEPHVRKTVNPGETAAKIGEIVAQNLVDNGATLQMGIGAVPDAALASLKEHKNLGIHTEMFSDGILPLVECNAIDNSKKFHQPGRMTVSFVYGSKKLYDFLHDNTFIHFGDVEWVNNPAIIRQNPKVTAINSAVEVDLTGQVVSDSIGKRFISGFGGQVDFIRGAAISNDGLGKAIITLPSTTSKGESKIVPYIHEGSGVVTSRSHVNYVVTEYGIAQLWGKNMRQRAHALINIAHPDQRASLEKAAFERLKVMPSAD